MADQLQPVKDPTSDQNFRQVIQRLASLVRRLASFEATEAFPRLVTPASRKINFGTAEVEWAAKGFSATGKTVEHGLGVEPKAVVCTFFDNNKKVLAWVTTREWSSTKFTAIAVNFTEVAEGTKGKVAWTAIG